MNRIAVTLAALLMYNSFAMPLAQASAIAQPPIGNISSQHNGFIAQPQKVKKSSDIPAFRVPASVGSIVETYAPTKASRLVYHLQDVHKHVPAQINLSEIVSLLEAHAATQGKRLVVAVEGVTGLVDSDSIAKIQNQKAKEDVAAGLLKSGYLLGEEYAAITHAPGRIQLIGIEEPTLYKKNGQARDLSIESRAAVLNILRETHAQLEKLVPHNFNQILTRLETMRSQVEQGTLPLTDYVTFLKATNPAIIAQHPNLARMAALTAAEAGIDFAKVEEQGRSLVQDVMVNKSETEVDQMLTDAQALKEGRLSALSYYSLLLGQAKKDYPIVRKYVDYLRTSDSINSDQLFDEVLEAENQIAKSLVKHPVAMELYEYIRWVERQEWFFSLSMIPQDWAEQKNVEAKTIISKHSAIRSFVAEQVGDLGYAFNTPELSMETLLPAYSGAHTFYEAASERNETMVSNLNKIIRNPANDDAVIAFVAGGFHTPGMTKLLKDEGYAYQVIRPQLETDVELSEEIKFPQKNVSYYRAPETIATEGGAEAVKGAIGNAPAVNVEDVARQIEKGASPEEGSDRGPNDGGRKGFSVVEVLVAIVGVASVTAISLYLFQDFRAGTLTGAKIGYSVLGLFGALVFAAIMQGVTGNTGSDLGGGKSIEAQASNEAKVTTNTLQDEATRKKAFAIELKAFFEKYRSRQSSDPRLIVADVYDQDSTSETQAIDGEGFVKVVQALSVVASGSPLNAAIVVSASEGDVSVVDAYSNQMRAYQNSQNAQAAGLSFFGTATQGTNVLDTLKSIPSLRDNANEGTAYVVGGQASYTGVGVEHHYVSRGAVQRAVKAFVVGRYGAGHAEELSQELLNILGRRWGNIEGHFTDAMITQMFTEIMA